MARVRVAVVDGDARNRAELVNRLKGIPEIDVKGDAGEGSAVLDLIVRHDLDVLLLDLSTPRTNIAEFVRLIRDMPAGKRCRVVMLVNTCNDRGLLDAISAGAEDYLLKDSGPDELRSAITGVFEGARDSSHRPFQRPETTADRMEMGSGQICLSPREMEVLACLIDGKTSLQIAEKLFISENTVKTHIRHIFIKLSVSSRAEAVRKAAELGLI